MNARSTWSWFFVAVALFASIVVYHKVAHKAPPGPIKVLPGLKAEAVTAVQVRPGAGVAVQVQRTNGVWELTAPQTYPAQQAGVQSLLAALEHLTAPTVITARELRGKTNADEEYGFATPQATITLQQPDYHRLVEVGARTAPGDQVFLRVVGNVYVVDAGILKYLPASPDAWRDTTLIDLNGLAFDHLSVTNGTKIVQFTRASTNAPWRMAYPFSARADNYKLRDALQRLESLRILQFVPADGKADLDTFGLQTPDLELGFGVGTNPPTVLQFGRSPTNDSSLVYARRVGRNAVVGVAADLLTPWRDKVNDFRDSYLLNIQSSPALLEVHGADNFELQRETNGTWRVLPQGFAADTDSAKDLFSRLNSLRTTEFIDVVIEPDLPNYGLALPALRYTLRSAPANPAADATNAIIADLSFGTNQAGRAFARRADESFVYGISTNDFHRLPAASWQLRDRTLWHLSTNDIARVIIHQEGKVRELRRNGPYQWSLQTPGTFKNDLALEEIVRSLCQLTATAWVAHGEQCRANYGLSDKSFQITLELKNGDKKRLAFGRQAASGAPYAETTLDGEVWILEFPLALCPDVAECLTIPADVP